MHGRLPSGSSARGAPFGAFRRRVERLKATAGRRHRLKFWRLARVHQLKFWRRLARVQSSRFGRRLKPWLRPLRRASGRGYDFLYRRRMFIRPYFWVVSDVVSRIQHAGPSIRLVNSLAGRSRADIVSRVGMALVRSFLVTAIEVHIVSGRTRRALESGRLLNLLFREEVRRRRQLVFYAYVHALLSGNLLESIVREVRCTESLADVHVNKLLGVALLYGRRTDLARYYLERATALRSSNYLAHRMLGRVHLIEGDLNSARRRFEISVDLAPKTVMAHQNYAGRYEIDRYRPRPWEIANVGELLIFDNLGQYAEDVFLRGRFQESFEIYARLLAHQDEISRDKRLPDLLRLRVAAECPRFRGELPDRILPYEWVTQFGHLGLLDAYLKRAAIGEMREANHILLAPPKKVANHRYVAYYDDKMCVVRDPELVEDLFPYQRYFGEGFMVTRGPEGPEPWVRAAARAQVEWARRGSPPLLELSEIDRWRGSETMRRLGVPDDAWYVGLHVREGGYYGEAKGGMSDHRNARIEDYLPAVEEITARGGWVLRLGDPSMKPLPRLENLVDYAAIRTSNTDYEATDLYILATSRFVIGTTSGLTTVAQTFGTRMLLVNCISNDWQLWSDSADFVLRPIWNRRDRRYLRIGEAYRQPLRGMLINNTLIHRHGYEPHANTPDEILRAVRYELGVLEGRLARIGENHPLMQHYRKEIADDPYLFGAARPALPFLENQFGGGGAPP